jgi:hypothetical protein
MSNDYELRLAMQIFTVMAFGVSYHVCFFRQAH